MPSSRSCRSSYDCIVKIKGGTMRPILFSQLMRSDGEGAMNPEELFADDRSPASEQERVHEDELHSLMRSILDWAISSYILSATVFGCGTHRFQRSGSVSLLSTTNMG